MILSKMLLLMLCKLTEAMQNKVYGGVMGGVDSWLISGCSGIGKSQAISRAIDLITANGIIETQKPFTKIIPCLVVQCPFDSSVKGLLLEILRKVDEILDSNYYMKSLKNRVTTDMQEHYRVDYSEYFILSENTD